MLEPPVQQRNAAIGFRILHATDQVWRVTNPLGVVNANLTHQLGFDDLTLRLWRLSPGQAMPRHRHQFQTEIYVLLEGGGRLRVDGTLLILDPMSSVLVEPESVRQVFNDTDTDALWLIAGVPPEAFPLTADQHAAERDRLYPDGVDAMPSELEST
jgi:quercetin dioxygenase-like cupin family protein